MAEFTRRLQILVDEERWRRLERQADLRGTSVATVVREAIDASFPPAQPTAAEAAEQFLARPSLDLGDWESGKAAIEDAMNRGAPD